MEEAKPTPHSIWVSVFIGDIAYAGWIEPIDKDLVRSRKQTRQNLTTLVEKESREDE